MRKVGVSSLHQFPVNQALWRIFTHARVWATVHFSKDEDDFKRIVQILEVQKIQTFFESVQAQISNFRLRDQEIGGLSEQVDWTDGCWRKYSSLDGRICEQVKSTKNVFQ